MLLGACDAAKKESEKQARQRNWARTRGDIKYNHALQRLSQGSVDEAIAALEEALRLDNDDPAVLRLLALCRLEKGDPYGARQALQRARELGDDSAHWSYVAGLADEYQSRFDDAADRFLTAARAAPDNADYLLAAAESLTTVDRRDQALALLDAHLDPAGPTNHGGAMGTDPRLLLLRATIHLHSGDMEEAARDFERAGSAAYEIPWASEQYGTALMQLDRCREALAVLEPLCEDQPPDRVAGAPRVGQPSSQAIRALATCYQRLKRPRDAFALLDAHVEQHPDDARAWELFSTVAVTMGNLRTARRCAAAGMRLEPDDARWQVLLAYLDLKRGDLDSARRTVTRVLSRAPDNASAQRLLAAIDAARRAPESADHATPQ